MNDPVTPDSPEDLGNTIDGSGAGDGDQSPEDPDTGSEGTSPSAASPADQLGRAAGDQGSGGQGGSHHDREEQKKVYRTPEQPHRAVGGAEGTADGM